MGVNIYHLEKPTFTYVFIFFILNYGASEWDGLTQEISLFLLCL